MVSSSRPPVVKWFKAYCGFMIFLYAVIALASVAAFFIPQEEIPTTPDGPPIWLFSFLVTVMLTVSLGLVVIFALPWISAPKPWIWTLGTVLICIGFLNGLTIVASLFLLIYWLKPETRLYFGKSA